MPRLYGRGPSIAAVASLLFLYRILLIQRQVQLQHVHAGLSKKSILTSFGVFGEELAKLGFRNASGLGHARDLEVGSRRSNVRIESRAGGCHQVHGDRL